MDSKQTGVGEFVEGWELSDWGIPQLDANPGRLLILEVARVNALAL